MHLTTPITTTTTTINNFLLLLLTLLSLTTTPTPAAAAAAASTLRSSSTKAPAPNAIKLSTVQTLTLHANRKTTHRRVPAIPQLTCVGPSSQICSLYTPDVMRCVNAGAGDSGDEDVAWTCDAQLPVEFKLGSTDVVCEGYRDAEDEWVLKGSCGLRYRMLLTEEGEKRFGGDKGEERGPLGWAEWLANMLFFGLFVCVALVIFSAAMGWLGGNGGGGNGWGGGGGGGGDGGGGGMGPYDDPPPPYEDIPGRKSTRTTRSYGTAGPRQQQQAWRPGFWSGAAGGAAGGAAAGYAAGRYAGGRQQRAGGFFGNGDNGGESSSSSPSPSFSSSRHESTGFGSTSRR